MKNPDRIVPILSRALLVASLALAAVSCSDGSAMGGGKGGGGGSGGAGGAGGAIDAGAGGSGGAPPADGGSAIPGCLRDLYAACPYTGCRYSTDDAGTATYCYDSSPHSEIVGGSGGCQDRQETRVSKADGSLCYTLVRVGTTPALPCEGFMYTWRDGADRLVATADSSIGGLVVQCAFTDQMLSCSGQNCPTSLYGGPTDCQPGVCP